MTIPAQTDPSDYAYSSSTTFTAAFIASDASCAIDYTCVPPASGVDWCSDGTLDSATGVWLLDTSTIVPAPNATSHPPGTSIIQVSGEISGYPSSS